MVPEHSPARANPARGLALIATAVIIGIFVLRQGWDNAPGASAASGGTPTEEGGEAADGATETTPPTTPEHLTSEVTVRVFNATDVGGAAGGLTEALNNEGYVTVEATDAPADFSPDVTEVFYIPGFDREAASLAQAIEAQPSAVKPFPNPPPAMDPLGSQVMVVLGLDLAESFVG